MSEDNIRVEVAYALPEKQKIVALDVAPGCTAREAVRLSNIVQRFPEIDVENCSVGIFGHALGARGMKSAEEYVMQPGDRVEIYRPLIADPKEVRKKRAAEAAKRRKEN